MEKLEEYCRKALEQGPDGCLIFENGRCVFYSPNYHRIVRYPANEPLNSEATALKKLLHPDDRERVLDTFDAAVREHRFSATFAFRGKVKGGHYRWREDHARFVYDEEGQHVKTFVVARDIEGRLEDPLFLPRRPQDEGGRRELHHRIKNDLELLRSLLSLQANNSDSEEVKEAMVDAAQRVGSLVYLYETLNRSGEYDTVDLTQLLGELLPPLRSKVHSRGVTISGHAEPDSCIPVRLARTVSLVINELTTNALKHASPVEGHLSVEITLAYTDDQLTLTVRDSGPGYPQGVLQGTTSGFGLEIAKNLALQHDGSIELRNDAGAVAVFTLPVA